MKVISEWGEGFEKGVVDCVKDKIGICHLTTAPSNRIPRLIREVDTASKAGYTNYIVCSGKSEETETAQIVGIRTARNRWDRYLNLSREVFNVGDKISAEIYQVHDPELLRYAKKIKSKGKKVVFDSHENYMTRIYDRIWIPACFKGLLNIWFKKYMKRCLKYVDAVLGANEKIVESLNTFNNYCESIMNFPLFRDLEVVEKNNKFSICYTGAITDQYSILELMDIFDKIESIDVVMCGVADEGYIPKLKEKPFWEKVSYLGAIPQKEAFEIQKKSSMGIVILKYSNNTNGKYGTMANTKLFEYLMSGIPVVCSDFTCWEEIISKYNCGICVNPQDSEAIKNAIEKLRDDSDLAEIMGRNARKAAEEIYNWNSQGEKLLEVYERVRKG